MTEVPPYFTANSLNQIMAGGSVRVLTAFMVAEGEAFRSQNPTSALQGEAAEMAADFKEFKDAIDDQVNRLMVERLIANQRNTPLLRASDTDRIIGMLLEGQSMTSDVMAGMAMARPLIELVIAGKINFLTAIDDNPYVAFWRFVGAITNAIIDGRCTPEQVTQLPEARIAVYRACMTPGSWRKLTTATVALMSGMSASNLMGRIGSTLSSDAAATLDTILAQADDASAVQRTERAKKARAFYTKLGRQIWPATRG